MTRQYTDTENTGFAAVPLMTSTTSTDEETRRETMEEDVWSHRLPAEGER